jgi:fibronectin type 3 domain-containing protein
MVYGLYVVKPNPPYGRPTSFSISSKTNQSGTILTWSSAENARGYSVLRSKSASGPYVQIAEHLIETSYTDKSSPLATNYYRVVAKNGQGVTKSWIVFSDGALIKPSKASK